MTATKGGVPFATINHSEAEGSQTQTRIFVSNRQCSVRREEALETMEDDKLRTVHCLRGRLLAERVASKAAKEEAEKLAKRLEELEKKIAEEIKCRNRAEKKLKYAIKKLESLMLLDGRDQMDIPLSSVSSSSSQCFLGQQRLESEMSGSLNVDLEQCGCGLREDVKMMPGSLGSEDLLGDDASASSPGESARQLVSLEGSWTSTGTAKSQYKEVPDMVEADKGFSPQEWCALSGDKQETSAHESESEDNMLALVPVSKQLDLEVGKPEIKDNVQGVLLALRNVKEQLLHSLKRRADIYSSREFFDDLRDSRRSPFCCRTFH